MARPLRETPPSSAVARLLDVGAAARAITATAVTAPETTNVDLRPGPADEPRSGDLTRPALVKREFVLTPAAERSLLTLIDSIRRATGARVSASHVLRALLVAVEHAGPQIDHEARRLGALKLPSNASGRDSERAAFERRIAAALVAGLRAASALGSVP